MLQTASIDFPSADLSGDSQECRLPQGTFDAREASLAPGEPVMFTPRSVFVSCWNLSGYENAALWSVYGKGVAIESTYSLLRDSFDSFEEPVHIGRVHY